METNTNADVATTPAASSQPAQTTGDNAAAVSEAGAATQAAATTAATDNPFGFPPAAGTEETAGTQTANPGAEQQPEAAVIPDKYEFQLPEGLQITPEIETKFTELAKGMKLTQEQANGLIRLHSEIMMDVMKQAEQQKNTWVNECHKAGLSTPEKLKTAKLAVDSFDETGKVMQELIDSGLAYSPNVQRFLQLIGSYLAEDTAPDSKPAAQAKSAADLLFSNSKY